MMSFLYPIDPITSEILRDRPRLNIESVNTYLGRNDETDLDDPRLMEKYVKIYKKPNNDKVYAFVCKEGPPDAVQINGSASSRGTRRELHDGDVISFFNWDGLEYRYRYGGDDDNNTTAANNNNQHATATTTTHAAPPPAAAARMPQAPSSSSAAAAPIAATAVAPARADDVASFSEAPVAPRSLFASVPNMSSSSSDDEAAVVSQVATLPSYAAAAMAPRDGERDEENPEPITKPPPTISQAAMAKFPKELGENITCAVCMDILLYPRSMVPCGHSFCQECAAKLINCAQCRHHVHGQITCRSLHSLVESMVNISTNTGFGIISEDDLESYRQRKRAADGAATAASNAAGKRRRVNYAGTNDRPICLS